MNSFKDIAYQILKEKGRPLHSKEITKIARNRGWLKTVGKTPEATMNASLIVDINSKKEKSRFKKTGPSIFGINERSAPKEKIRGQKQEKVYKISKNVSSTQKGDIAEARIAELITLYGDTTLSCYKPISDDEGIDLIVKDKKSNKVVFVQVKSIWRDTKTFVATVKRKGVLKSNKSFVVFCLIDTEEMDMWDYLWLIPTPEFVKLASYQKKTDRYVFVSGLTRRESNQWNRYLIDKRDLANQIIAQMKRA